MFFGKKLKEIKCTRCEGILKKEFSFCPYCGTSLVTKEEMERNYGLLGKNDSVANAGPETMMNSNLGITDKIINNMFNMVMKNLGQQMRDDMEHAEISQLPNGIKISIGQAPRRKQVPRIIKKTLTEDQLQRLATLPRKEAKSTIRRLSDKVVYELNTPGVLTTEDIFISKLESGYEVKALGNKNMYVNSLQIGLPLKGISLDKNKVLVEFKTQQD